MARHMEPFRTLDTKVNQESVTFGYYLQRIKFVLRLKVYQVYLLLGILPIYNKMMLGRELVRIRSRNIYGNRS